MSQQQNQATRRPGLRAKRYPRLPSLALISVAVWLCGWGAASQDQTATRHEYELKAGVLYHIIEYVQWPKDAQSNSPSAIQIGLLGHIPFAEALEELNGRNIRGKELVVKRLADPHDAAQCQVVYIGASEKPRVREIMAEVKNRPVLTVGEIEGFAEHGGMINLVASPDRIGIEINREQTHRAKLGISSQLLKLAKVIGQ